MRRKKDKKTGDLFDWGKAHQRVLPSPAPDNGQDWGCPYVRPTDPDTSHEAAAELDEASASAEAFSYFVRAYPLSSDGLTRAEFEQFVDGTLQAQGWDEERAYRKGESLRRRLTELHHKYKKLYLRYDSVVSKDGTVKNKKRKRGTQEVLYLEP